MKNNAILTICSHFNLGNPIAEPERVYGGLLHKMWQLETEKGCFALKQLSPDINLSNATIVHNYNKTEHIASCFMKAGISTVCALEKDGDYLFILDGVGYLVYPWITGVTAERAVSDKQAFKIADILARMHRLDLKVSGIADVSFDTHDNTHIISLAEKAFQYQCSFSDVLNNMLPELIAINNAYLQATQILKDQTVVSHGDLDPKNVLWDEQGNPVLIDWESARKLNPVYEIVNAALDWSSIYKDQGTDLLINMIKAYEKSGGIINSAYLEASFYGVLGNWINWLVYNIERACCTPGSERNKTGEEQVHQTLTIISKLHPVIPELVRCLS